MNRSIPALAPYCSFKDNADSTVHFRAHRLTSWTQSGLENQGANGEMRQPQTVELLLDQLRGLAAQYHLGTCQVRLELLQGVPDLLALVIKRRQLLGRGALWIEQCGQ